jgi:hypothetical protein
VLVLMLPMIGALAWGIYHDIRYGDSEPLVKVGWGFIVILCLLFAQVIANS